MASAPQTCLAFGPVGDDFVGILGKSQKTFAVIYDVDSNKIWFRARALFYLSSVSYF